MEVRTLAVERALEPLVLQVTTLCDGSRTKRKGRSKRPEILVAAVERATQQFILQGEMVAKELAEEPLQSKLFECLDRIKRHGDLMSMASKEFSIDPLSNNKRQTMIRHARDLLSSVTRLLTLADEVDVVNLLKRLQLVKEALRKVALAGDTSALDEAFKDLAPIWSSTDPQLAERQNILKDSLRRDDMARARGDVRQNMDPLYTASQAFLSHPNVASAKENKDQVIHKISCALETIESTIMAREPKMPEPLPGPNIANQLEEFEIACEDLEPINFEEKVERPPLEDRLSKIMNGAAMLADLGNTRKDRRMKIVQECKNVQKALQELLSEYEENAGNPEKTREIQLKMNQLAATDEKLGGHLRKAVMDSVSDNFIKTDIPLMVMMEAAISGKQNDLKGTR